MSASSVMTPTIGDNKLVVMNSAISVLLIIVTVSSLMSCHWSARPARNPIILSTSTRGTALHPSKDVRSITLMMRC